MKDKRYADVLALFDEMLATYKEGTKPDLEVRVVRARVRVRVRAGHVQGGHEARPRGRHANPNPNRPNPNPNYKEGTKPDLEVADA